MKERLILKGNLIHIVDYFPDYFFGQGGEAECGYAQSLHHLCSDNNPVGIQRTMYTIRIDPGSAFRKLMALALYYHLNIADCLHFKDLISNRDLIYCTEVKDL